MSSAAIRSAASGRTSDLAGIAVYLASDEAAWTSGGIFAVDGGYTAG
ncbi:SDR family oxidoreductase [Mesorhizobium sp. M1182]